MLRLRGSGGALHYGQWDTGESPRSYRHCRLFFFFVDANVVREGPLVDTGDSLGLLAEEPLSCADNAFS